MKELKQHKVFISAQTTKHTNEWAHGRLEQVLTNNDLPNFVQAEGCYNGVTEKSLCVFLGTEYTKARERIGKLINIGYSFKQESILYVDNEDTATLIYCAFGKESRLGTLYQVDTPSGGYSKINDQLYAIK